MKYKLLIIAVALGVTGAAVGGVLYLAYPVQVTTLAAMVHNYLLSWSAPPGTTTTELNAAYKAGTAASLPATGASSPITTAGDWPSYNRTLTSERYSQLSQINTKNAGKLKVLCTYDVNEYTAFESGLIMVDNALIGTTEFDIFSLNPATCAVNWRTHKDYPPALLPSNRGAAYLDGMLFRGTQDGRVLAYDFKTGKRIWETTIADPKHGESVPSAPIASDGLVFVGNAGGDFKGGKGHMFALDAKTGKIVWEFFWYPKSTATPSADHWARRRSTHRNGRIRPASPSAAAGHGHPTPSTRKPGCSTSPAAIRPLTSSSACAGETIPFRTRSWCSMPRAETTKIISRS